MPTTELHYVNNYTLLVAVVLSAQSTDAGVNKATKGLFRAADNPQAMLNLGEDLVREHIKTIGLYRNKAANLIKLSRQLLLLHSGEVPADRAALEALPGVGRKTAGVVLNVAFGQPVIPVDTHIFRVSHRLGLSRAPTPDQVEADLTALIPDIYLHEAHHRLIMHGRYVCRARNPNCDTCLLSDFCDFAVAQGRASCQPQSKVASL